MIHWLTALIVIQTLLRYIRNTGGYHKDDFPLLEVHIEKKYYEWLNLSKDTYKIKCKEKNLS